MNLIGFPPVTSMSSTRRFLKWRILTGPDVWQVYIGSKLCSVRWKREAIQFVILSKDWCANDLVRVSKTLKHESNVYQLIAFRKPIFQIQYMTFLPQEYPTLHTFISPNTIRKRLGGRVLKTKKTIHYNSNKGASKVVPQMPLYPPREHSSHTAHNVFSIPKGNYLRFPVLSFVWHMFLLHFILWSVLYFMKSLQEAIYHIILLSAILVHHQNFEKQNHSGLENPWRAPGSSNSAQDKPAFGAGSDNSLLYFIWNGLWVKDTNSPEDED